MTGKSDHCRLPSARTVLRWTGRGILLLGTLLAVLSLPLACTTRVIPPPSPLDPATVIIVDHGDTPSLVLPAADTGMVRYAYGEWQWYALSNTGYVRALPTLLLPTQGTLGRKEMDGAIDEATVASRMTIGFQRMHRIEVERAAVDRLRNRLDAIFKQNHQTLVFNRTRDLHFVHHPRRYTYFFNSNHMLASWLEELDCEVQGPAFVSRWQIGPDRNRATVATVDASHWNAGHRLDHRNPTDTPEKRKAQVVGNAPFIGIKSWVHRQLHSFYARLTI